MFDWLQFSPERLLRPEVITLLVFLVAGFILFMAGGALGRALCKKEETAAKAGIALRAIGGVAFIASLIAALLVI